MAVNRGAHVLPGHDGADLLLRRDVLSGSGLPQGVEGEGGVPIHLRAGEELTSPAEREVWITHTVGSSTQKGFSSPSLSCFCTSSGGT